MREFFELPEVRELQDMQKRSPFGSVPHRSAFVAMKELAISRGLSELQVEEYFGNYEESD